MTYLAAVEPDVRLVVDAAKKKLESLLRKHIVRKVERASVPPVLPAEVIRNGQVVQTVIWVRINTLVNQSPEDGAGNGCVIPVVSHYLVSLAKLPARSDFPGIVSHRAKHCLSGLPGHSFRHLHRNGAPWQSFLRLRRRQAEVGRQQLLMRLLRTEACCTEHCERQRDKVIPECHRLLYYKYFFFPFVQAETLECKGTV